MQKFKKAIAILLITVMLFSTVSVGITAFAASESEGNENGTVEYRPLTLDTEFTIPNFDGGAEAWFTFTPTVSDTYIFNSDAGETHFDVFAYLYTMSEDGLVDIAYDDDSGTNLQFCLTQSLTAGQTYYYCVGAYSCVEPTDVTVKLAATPLDSIVFKPLTMIEGINGYTTTDYNGNEFFYYHWYDYLNYTVTFKSGEVIEGEGESFSYGDNNYSLSYDYDQYSNPMLVGNTYTVSLSVMGCSAETDITIKKLPDNSTALGFDTDTSVSVKSNFGEWLTFTPNVSDIYTFKSSSGDTYCDVYAYLYSVSEDGSLEEIAYDDDGNNNGNFNLSAHLNANQTYYYCVGAFNSYRPCSITVKLSVSPIESIYFSPIDMVVNYDGNWSENVNGGEYFYYNWINNLEYTVYLKNGSSTSGRGSSISYYDDDGNYVSLGVGSSDTQHENPWKPGNTYPVTISVAGKEYTTTISIIESPVESLVIEPVFIPEYTSGHYESNMFGQYFHYEPRYMWNYTVKFKNGETIKSTDWSFYYNGRWNSIEIDTDQHENHWVAGNSYTATAKVLGYETEFDVTIYKTVSVDGFEYFLQDDNAIIIGCNKEDTILTIPSSVDGHTVVGITDITGGIYYAQELVIPNTVTMISNNLFRGGENLTRITLGSGIKTLSNDMFKACDNLNEIIVSSSNPNYASVDGVVYDKDITTVIVFPRAKTGRYTVPDTVTDISVVINNWDSYDIELDLGNSNTGYSFVDGVLYTADMTTVLMCTPDKTGTYIMPDSVTTINEAAFQGSRLSEIIVSDNVTDIVYCAFAYSMNLERVVLPDNLKSISDFAFYRCENLTETDLPSGLTELGYQSFAETGILSVNIPSSLKTIGDCAYYMSALEELTFEEGVSYIGDCAFECTKITELVLPDSLTGMGSYSFDNTPLESLEIGSGLRVISTGAFASTNLTTVTLPYNVEYISSSAFANSALEEVIIEYDAVVIETYAFFECPLKELNLKEGTAAIYDYAFYGSSIEKLELPQSVTDITYHSFAESKQLLTIDVSDQLETLCGTAFDGTAWLDSKPNGVVYLENYLYGYKGKISKGTEITVEDGTTLIADYAFDEEVYLKKLTIPASVKHIGYGALHACFSLEQVVVDSENEYFSTNQDGTVLYDSDGDAVWKKIESIDYVDSLNDYFFAGETPYSGWSFIHVTYVDGTQGSILYTPKASDISGLDLSKSGYQTVTLHLGDFKYHYEVYVAPPVFDYITIDQLPNKTVYDLNESFKPAGLIVSGVCSNGDSYQITDYDIYGFDSSHVGTQTITVSYYGWELCFTVEVKDDNITYVDNNQHDDAKIEISVPQDAIDSDASLVVDEFVPEDIENIEVPEEFTNSNSVIYDIYFEMDEQVVQPTKTVTVSIPVPFGFNGNACKIFHITDGESVDMQAEFIDGYLVFTTSHFSYYAVLEQSCEDLGGHNYTAEITSPSCEEDGFTVYTCDVCGDRYVDDYEYAIGHNYVAEVTPPTCEEYGYTTHICYSCGDWYVTDYVDAFDHNYVAEVTPPSCEDEGYTTHICYGCGDWYATDFVSSFNGHIWSMGEDGFVCVRNNCDAFIIAGVEGEFNWCIESGVLRIYGSGAMSDYNLTTNRPSWEQYKDVITSVVIEDGITYIGSRAFLNYTNLESVKFGASVQKTGYECFYGCTSLINVELNDGITELGSLLFYNCAFETIELPDTIVKINNRVFKNCTNLIEIDLPDNVGYLGYEIFMNCTSLTYVDFYTDESIILNSLTFAGCSNLSYFFVPMSVLRIRSNAFRDCENLLEVVFEDDDKLMKSSTESAIASTAFDNCLNLVVWGWTNGTVNAYCSNRDIPFEATNSTIFSYSVNDDGESITITKKRGSYSKIIIPDTIDGYTVTAIGDAVFRGDTKLTSVTLPETLTTIGGRAFQGTKLTTIAIPASVTTINHNAFNGCTALGEIYVPNTVTTIHNTAFVGCTAATIMTQAKSAAATAATKQNVPVKVVTCFDYTVNADGKTVTVTGALPNVSNLVIGETIDGKTVTAIAGSAFRDNTQITSVTLPSTITVIPGRAFQASGITSIVIPATVTEVQYSAFQDCANLTEVTFESATTTIHNTAFNGVTGLTIYGVADSRAEIFATNKGYTFVAI